MDLLLLCTHQQHNAPFCFGPAFFAHAPAVRNSSSVLGRFKKHGSDRAKRKREAGDFIFGSSLFGVFGIFLEEEKGRRRRQNNDRDYLGALLSSQPACVCLRTRVPTIDTDTDALLFPDL